MQHDKFAAEDDSDSPYSGERSLQQLEPQINRSRAQSDPLRTTDIMVKYPIAPKNISDMLKRAAELSKKQQEHMLNAERLQQRLTRGEHALGEQLRESLKIQRAIQEGREQNRIYKQQLDAERAKSKLVADGLDEILKAIMYKDWRSPSSVCRAGP